MHVDPCSYHEYDMQTRMKRKNMNFKQIYTLNFVGLSIQCLVIDLLIRTQRVIILATTSIHDHHHGRRHNMSRCSKGNIIKYRQNYTLNFFGLSRDCLVIVLWTTALCVFYMLKQQGQSCRCIIKEKRK